jgi:hypothetical protein
MAPFVAECPPLLPGEMEEKYYAMFDQLMDEICPNTASEWLLFADIVWLFWELGRYRAWKAAILKVSRRAALMSALGETNPTYAVVSAPKYVANIAKKEAEEWRTDPQKRRVLEARLAAHGYDEVALNAGALQEGLVPLTTIERFLTSVRGQLNAILREVCVRREFADRARKALKDRAEVAVPIPVPKQIEQSDKAA